MKHDLSTTVVRIIHRGKNETRGTDGEALIDADLLPLSLRVAALSGLVTPEWFESRLANPRISETKRKHLLSAFGWFSEAGDIDHCLEYAMAHVRQHNRHYPVGAASANTNARYRLLPWLERSIDELTSMQRYAFARIVASVVPIAGIGEIARIHELVNSRMRGLGIDDTVDMAVEQLGVYDRFVTRNG